jgi:Tol biopolymer transport system component
MSAEMDGPSPELTPQPARTSDDRLDSWKEIAAYLKRDVTTVRRWEKREGMPVHRHVHDKLGSVYGFRSELDAWTRSRNPGFGQNESNVESPADRLEGQPPDEDDEAAQTEASASSPTQRQRRAALLWAAVAAVVAVGLGATWWRLASTDYFWRTPFAQAQFENVTDFGAEQAATVSRDGRFVAYLSDSSGTRDVWVTQLGVGQAYNLTHGRLQGLGNPSLRFLGFSPDGALVTFWTRGVQGSSANDISVWAVPALGGEPRPYLEGVAEFDWSSDGKRLVYHTPGPGDPTFVKDSGDQTPGRQIFAAAPGLHAHFPLWSPDSAFVYFVQGQLPDAMDIWRISPAGGPAERITNHNSRVSHPVFLDPRTLLYLATEQDGSGPWLTTMDVERRVPHRVGTGLDRYTSLAASTDGRRLVATLANPKGTLWRLNVGDQAAPTLAATPIALTTARGFSPRLGPGFLIYSSSKGTADVIWKLADGLTTELWSAPEARIVGGPEISPDGRRLAFSVEQRGKTVLYQMNVDGTSVRAITESLDLQGAPAWAPDGQSIASAANVNGTPHLFRISLDGTSTPLVQDYALDPVWSPAGDFLLYSGADIGTRFPVKSVTAAAKPYAIPNLTLTRGARRLRFLQGGQTLVFMRGDIEHKDLWLVDLQTGTERQLATLPADFDVRDFDVSADGHDVILERVQEQSTIVRIDLGTRE